MRASIVTVREARSVWRSLRRDLLNSDDAATSTWGEAGARRAPRRRAAIASGQRRLPLKDVAVPPLHEQPKQATL